MISKVRIAKELVKIAKELTASRRRLAWKFSETDGNGGIDDDYAYLVLDGNMERGQLIDVVPEASELFFKCGDWLKEAVLEYLPNSLRDKARIAWSPNNLEFLPSYFAGKDCVGYPMSRLGVTKADIEKARQDEALSLDYYDEEEKLSEREKSDRELNRKIEALQKDIQSKVGEIGKLKEEINRLNERGQNYSAKEQLYDRKINELNDKVSELERLTGSTAGVDTSVLEQDEWDF